LAGTVRDADEPFTMINNRRQSFGVFPAGRSRSVERCTFGARECEWKLPTCYGHCEWVCGRARQTQSRPENCPSHCCFRQSEAVGRKIKSLSSSPLTRCLSIIPCELLHLIANKAVVGGALRRQSIILTFGFSHCHCRTRRLIVKFV